MGYATYYTLNKIQGSDEDFEALVKDIEEKTGIDFSEDNSQEAKWYDHDADMTELSMKYPGLTVQLDGDGECSDDLWSTRYRNGESESASHIDAPRFCEIATPDERVSFVASAYTRAKKDFLRIIETIVHGKDGDLKTRILVKIDTESNCWCNRIYFRDDVLWCDLSVEEAGNDQKLPSSSTVDGGLTLDQLYMVANELVKIDLTQNAKP